MKTFKNLWLALSFLFWATLPVTAQSYGLQELAPYVKLVSGTGLTTGHIANLLLSNETSKDVVLTVGPYFIPSSGQYQPYIVPRSSVINLPAGHTSVIKLDGYCADVHKAAVPSSEELISITKWVVPSATAYPKTSGWNRSDHYKVNLKQQTGNTEYKLSYPGMDTEFIYAIDYDKYSADAASQLLDGILRLETAYDQLYEARMISSPYAAHPEKERAAIIQQAFWIFTSQLKEMPYTKTEFKDRMAKQYADKTGITMEGTEVKKQVDYGANSFWNSFIQVLKKAKIIL